MRDITLTLTIVMVVMSNDWVLSQDMCEYHICICIYQYHHDHHYLRC